MNYSGGIYPGRGGPWLPELRADSPAMETHRIIEHEAAHAVSVMVRGGRVASISVRGGRGTTTHTRLSERDTIATDLAGPAIEILNGGWKVDRNSSKSDFEDATKRATALGYTSEDIDDLMDEVGQELRDHRNVVDAVIGELTRNAGELDEAKLTEIGRFFGLIPEERDERSSERVTTMTTTIDTSKIVMGKASVEYGRPSEVRRRGISEPATTHEWPRFMPWVGGRPIGT